MIIIKKIFLDVIISEVFLTVMSGVLVFVISQYILELVIAPYKQYKSLKQKIIYMLTMYSCYYCNPYNLLDEKYNVRSHSEYDEASKEFRKLGSDLSGYLGTVPRFRKRKRKKLKIILDNLISISNGFYVVSKNYNPIQDSKECEKTIKKILNIK